MYTWPMYYFMMYFSSMDIFSDRLRSLNSPLMGFSKDIVLVEGVITLPIMVGQVPWQSTVQINFLVVRTFLAYNVILGRSELNVLRANGVDVPFASEVSNKAKDWRNLGRPSLGMAMLCSRSSREWAIQHSSYRRIGYPWGTNWGAWQTHRRSHPDPFGGWKYGAYSLDWI